MLQCDSSSLSDLSPGFSKSYGLENVTPVVLQSQCAVDSSDP